jgi:hypothetical protein
VKTADGTRSGTGQAIGNAGADHRNSSGYVLSGPDFLTVFRGTDGAILDIENYAPGRGNVADWGDNYGNRVDRFLTGSGVASNNGTKSTPVLQADILGDWREEVIWRTTDNRALRIYSTTDPTGITRPSLMQDRQYRVAVAWQNTAYNQPPHPSFATP